MHKLTCPEAGCGKPMVLKKTLKHRYQNGAPRLYYQCEGWPDCKGSIGARPDGTPTGTPADAATKAVRHETFEILEKFRLSRGWNKSGTYAWLAKRMKISRDASSITKFDAEQCRAVQDIVKRSEELEARKREKSDAATA